MTTERIALENRLDLLCEAVEACAHIRDPGGKPYTRTTGQPHSRG